MRHTNAIAETCALRLEALLTTRLRSSLTSSGRIGVATVMAMAAIVQVIRNQIVNTIEVAAPRRST